MHTFRQGTGFTREPVRIRCFHCGERDELEFTYGGPARIRLAPSRATVLEWATHLRRAEGQEVLNFERWCHTFGCGEWFHIGRDIRTLEIRAVFPIGGIQGAPTAASCDDSGH